MTPVPKIVKPKKRSLSPVTLAVIHTIGTLKSQVLLKVLLDSGSTKTMIHKRPLPRGCKLVSFGNKKKVTTLDGSMIANQMVHLRDIKLPEFDKNRTIDELKALVFNKKCRYHIILGADFLSKSGMDINYSDGTMKWFENIIQMQEPHVLDNREFLAMADSIEI